MSFEPCNRQARSMPRILRHVKMPLDALYPPFCPLCRKLTSRGICPTCISRLPRPERQCYRCGAACPGSPLCGKCRLTPPAYSLTIAPFSYAPPLAGLVHQLKYRRRIDLAGILARTLAIEIEARLLHRPQLIIPVPLHWKRLLRRGFNQSTEMARHLSRQLEIPLDRRSAFKCRRTASQAKLSLRRRRRNVRGCFKLQRELNVSSVAIFDDVITSGETVNELACELRRHAVPSIQVWALLRTETE